MNNILWTCENFICLKLDEFQKEKIVNELQKNVNDMSATIEFLKSSLDRQKQYSRRNCLLIDGIPESRSENTDDLVINTIKKKMGEKTKRDKID